MDGRGGPRSGQTGRAHGRQPPPPLRRDTRDGGGRPRPIRGDTSLTQPGRTVRRVDTTMAFPPWGKKPELRTEECEGHSRTPCSGTGRAPGPRPQGRDARAPGPASPGAEGRRAPHGLPRHRARPSSKACPGGPGRGPTGPGASVLCHTVKPACDTAHPGTTLDTRTRVTRTFKNTREERKAPHFATGNGRARGERQRAGRRAGPCRARGPVLTG